MWYLSRSTTEEIQAESETSPSLEIGLTIGTEGRLLELQRNIGNRSVQRMIARHGSDASGAPRRNVSKSSDGERLPYDTQESMGSGFRTHFSEVRIHTDEEAAKSAAAMGANAYTTGRDIYFARGKYAPQSSEGRHLLAHELAHTIQRQAEVGDSSVSAGQPSAITIVPSTDSTEREAERAAEIVTTSAHKIHSGAYISEARSKTQQRQAPQLTILGSAGTAGTVSLQSSSLPGFAQRGDTCEPASLITALIIWDRERADPANPNANIVGVCNTALIYLAQDKSALVAKWSVGGADGAKIYADRVSTLTRIRDDARRVSSAVTESQYQDIGIILSNLGSDIDSIMGKLGLSRTIEAQNTLADMFSSPTLTGLAAGQIAQIEWYVRKTDVTLSGEKVPGRGYHVFLIGRTKTGEWFLADQGNNPPLNLQGKDLPDLKAKLYEAAKTGRSWIETDPSVSRRPMTSTGVRVLGKPAFEQKHKALAPPGTFLAKLDGDSVNAWDFVGIAYSMGDARALFPGTGDGHGFLVGEMPAGVFNVYKTNPVSVHKNLWTGEEKFAGTIDSSAGGLLAQSTRAFEHAWLQLVDAKKKVWKASLISAY
jgi:hypothetical protein